MLKKTPENKIPQKQSGGMSMIGSAWNIVGGMIGCSMLGYFIGNKYGDYLIGTLIGMFLGLVYSGYEIWKLMRKLDNKK